MMSAPLFAPAAKQRLRDLVNRSVAALPSTITLKQKAGHDRYGDTWGPPVTYTVLLTYKQSVVFNAQAQQIVSVGQILFPFPAPIVNVEDQITLESGAQPPLHAVQRDGSPDPVRPTIVFI